MKKFFVLCVITGCWLPLKVGSAPLYVDLPGDISDEDFVEQKFAADQASGLDETQSQAYLLWSMYRNKTFKRPGWSRPVLTDGPEN